MGLAEELERRHAGLARGVAALCAGSADPDQALLGLVDLARVDAVALGEWGDPGWARLIQLLGASPALGRWLRQRPSDVEVVLAPVDPWSPSVIRADIAARVAAAGPGATDELRWAWRRHLMRIAARDLAAPDPAAQLETTCAELTDLADAVVETALLIARATVANHDRVRLGVVGLGKAGARELNYQSDVDLLWVAEPRQVDGQPQCSPPEAVAIATQLARQVAAICSAHTRAGTIWEVDANLRPEGAAGPLVRTLAGMEAYYGQWAHNWEFQAMLKARPMAGDLALASQFVDLVAARVWSAAERPGFVTEAQAMRARVVAHIPPGQAGRDIKLSAGGLRDTEFSVQLLQLVHGRADEALRLTGTWPGLAQLVAHGYVSRRDGAELDQAYRFQRLLEHRLQLAQLRRTHLMPSDEAGLRRLARSVGLRQPSEVQAAWRASTTTVLRLHQRIYYSPLLQAVARLPTDEVRLTPQAAAVRLRALGYADPTAALRHIDALTQGMSRRSEILRHLLPALLGWIADGPNPDAGLLAFRQVAEELGATPFFLRALRDEGEMAHDLARVLSSSRFAAWLIRHSPVSVEMLVGDQVRQQPTRAALDEELAQVVERYGTDPRGPDVIRATRRRELLRIALAELLGHLDAEAVGRQLSELTGATVAAALGVARQVVGQCPDMALIELGSWAGQEMTYTSDADLLVVLGDPASPAEVRQAGQVLTTLRQILTAAGPEPGLPIDVDLRPEGRDGPLARTLSSYRAYYEKWSMTWEAHALVRARAGAGSAAVAAGFLAAIAPIRYPAAGLPAPRLTEIRRLKARMEAERIGRGVDPRDHLKLGPGGLSDVEWTVQCLQLAHAWQIPELRVTGTLPALEAARQAGLVADGDAQALREAFQMAARLRNAITLLLNKASAVLPANASDIGQLAQLLGYGRAEGSHLRDDWHRVARRARAVVGRLFWGETD
jgi:glutamate-ammonia-ligase adenylyltransferase